MNPFTQLAASARRIIPALWSRALWLYDLVGAPGLITSACILAILGVNLALIGQNVAVVRQGEHDLIRSYLSVTQVDDAATGLNIKDYIQLWSIDDKSKNDPIVGVRAVLARVGEVVARRNKAPRRDPTSLSGIVRIIRIELAPRGGPIEASWKTSDEVPPGQNRPVTGRLENVLLEPADDRVAYEVNVDYEINRTVNRKVADALIAIGAIYRGAAWVPVYIVLAALAGGLGMAVQLRRYWKIKADEEADKAALNFVNQMTHELGNIIGGLTYNLRGIYGLLDLADSFTKEGYGAAEAAALRAGLGPEQVQRYLRQLRREYASRRMDPDVEWRGGIALGRSACRNVDVCARYLALAVDQLEERLHRMEGCPHRAQQEVRPEPVSLGDCLDDAVTLLAPRLVATSTQVDRNETSEHVRVRADWRLLVPTLVNVIKNAIESASYAGATPKIKIRAHREGEIVHLTVVDNGPGFSTDGLARAFQFGYSTKGAGRGRGLAIVRETLAAQGGEARVVNRASGGAEVLILLPAAPDE